MRWLAACVVGSLALACAEPPPPHGGVDAGFDAGRDGSLDDAGLDGAIAGDASPADAGTDAGADAGPTSGCACPALPTDCDAPAAGAPAFTPDALDAAGQLFSVVACAEEMLQIAIYQARWDCIERALSSALARRPSLRVELVVDDRECPPDSCDAELLRPSERVTIRRDARTALMHHKFAIADRSLLWVGSANFTARSFCTDVNDALAIDDPVIVDRYAAVFDRMFVEARFGPVAPEGPTRSDPYTVYFGPESPVNAPPAWLIAMVAAIEAATRSIEVMVFSWTRTELSDALVAAAARGVAVRALVAPLTAREAPPQALLAAGLDVRTANVHSKVLVVDGATVVTGSANWSASAWTNNESSLWIADAAIAAAYVARFEAAFAGAAAAERVP